MVSAGIISKCCHLAAERTNGMFNKQRECPPVSHGAGAPLSERRSTGRTSRSEICRPSPFAASHSSLPLSAVRRTDVMRAAQSFEFLLLQDAKQFWLQFSWSIADLVEKQGATVCPFEAAQALGNSACKRTPLMSEQFAFQ